MLPLLLIYIAEYTINQGVAPTLLFPLESSPFHHYRAFYPTYNAIYRTLLLYQIVAFGPRAFHHRIP